MKIMKDDKTVMSSGMAGSSLYKLQGSTVAGGVMDVFAGVAVHDPKVDVPVGSSSGGST